jgi:hypothetical protein
MAAATTRVMDALGPSIEKLFRGIGGRGLLMIMLVG